MACTEARGGEIARGDRVIRGRPIIEGHRVEVSRSLRRLKLSKKIDLDVFLTKNCLTRMFA